MARFVYKDGTHRMWIRITDEAEDALRHLAIDLKADSVESLAGRILANGVREEAAAIKPAKRKPDARPARPKPRG